MSRSILCGLFALAMVPATGCISPARKPTFEERWAEMRQPYDQLERQKAELWRAGYEQQDFVFEKAGTVQVLRWELWGTPGDVYLNARIRYVNTTDTPVEEAFVWLDVLDNYEQVTGSTAVRLVNPMGYPFWPGHSYTTEIRARTNGAHLNPNGWSWTIACEATRDDDPGPKPVLINFDIEYERARWSAQARQYYRTPYFASPLRQGPQVPGETNSGSWWQ